MLHISFSDLELRQIAAQATSLQRQGHSKPQLSNTEKDDYAQQIETRLNHWKRLLAKRGSANNFSRRLELEGLTMESCWELLVPHEISEIDPIPSWTRLLNNVFESESFTSGINTSPNYLRSDTPLPFEEIFFPFVDFANHIVEQQTCNCRQEITTSAVMSMQWQLLKDITEIASIALWNKFRSYLGENDPLAIILEQGSEKKNYNRFLLLMLERGGLKYFFKTHPVLARTISVCIEQWITYHVEFLERVNGDIEKLSSKFNKSLPLGQITSLSPGLSDRHHNGRMVMKIQFESGLKLIYKPKNLGTEEKFSELVAKLNQYLTLNQLKATQILNCDHYGWAEYIENKPCQSQDQIKRFYERMGMLLCLSYVLEGTDLHMDNLVACGEFPILIDLETLFHHRPRSRKEQPNTSDSQAQASLNHSVMGTGLLPIWMSGKSGRSYDVSGLGAVENQITGFLVPNWQQINTDNMLLNYVEEVELAAQNNPIFDNHRIPAKGFADEIVTGFKIMHHCLSAYRNELLKDQGPILAFTGQPVRFIVRATGIYGFLLDRLKEPHLLENGIDRSLEMEVLTRSILETDDESIQDGWLIFKQERIEIERGDVPYFYGYTDCPHLFANGRLIIKNFFESPSLQTVISRIRNLNEADCQRQCGYIRATLSARFGHVKNTSTIVPRDVDQLTTYSHDRFLDAAVSIAETIEAQAIYGQNDDASWISLQIHQKIGKRCLQPIGNDFYDGRMGIAFFLAAIAHTTQKESYGQLAMSAIRPIQTKLHHINKLNPSHKWNWGIANGLGGIIYCLIKTSQWLNCADLLADATTFAQLFTDEKIFQDKSLDIIDGVAGGLLALLALYKVNPDPMILDRATSCGYHLINQRVLHSSGFHSWLIHDELQPLTGFAHGAAGIAHALLQLYQHTGNHTFLDAAKEGIDFERALFSHTACNWPDLRHEHTQPTEYQRFQTAWCNGAPGIGLARLAGLDILDTSQIRSDINHALKTTLEYPLTIYDHLCCGNSGRIDFLIESSRRLNRDDILNAVYKKATWMSLPANGQYSLATGDNLYSPSLFQGIAGIGYTFLRLVDDRLSSVLMLT